MLAPSGTFLRTRVARRVLGLFLLCAMLPVTVLSVYGYRYLAGELERRALDQLRSDSKAAGMLIFDRLAGLAGYLDQVAIHAGKALPISPGTGSTSELGPRFRAIALESPDGRIEPLVGQDIHAPPLDRARLRHLERGNVALVAHPARSAVEVFLVRQLAGGSRLWGLVESATVWEADTDHSPAPPDRTVCVYTVELLPLSCTSGEALTAAGAENDAATPKWTSNGERFVGGRWTIFLGRDFASPAWTVVVGVPEQAIYAPLAALRWTFLLGLILALAIVFMLSHVQLRRITQPLEALQAGTVRVAGGDFGHPVEVQSDDEFGALASSFNRMARDLGRQFETQRALQEVHRTALVSADPALLLGALFGARPHILPGGELTVALARPDDPLWWTVSTESVVAADRPARDVRPAREELEELRAHPQGLVVRRSERARSYFSRPDEIPLRETIVLPILRKGTLTGALVLTCEPDEEGKADILTEARRSADRVAVAISNTQLVEQLDAMSWGALTALARTIDAVSPWTAGHSERVTVGALEIARRLGLSQEETDLLHRGGLLHDIGKVGVPVAILDKAGPLTPEEFEVVRRHPTTGARILAPLGAFRQALPLVLHHHELLDGSGYPHGLRGNQIPRLVRILTVADVFDALVSDRPYRAAWPVPDAVGYLTHHAGTKFDSETVAALSAVLASGWKPAEPTEVATEPGGVARFRAKPERAEVPPIGESAAAALAPR